VNDEQRDVLSLLSKETHLCETASKHGLESLSKSRSIKIGKVLKSMLNLPNRNPRKKVSAPQELSPMTSTTRNFSTTETPVGEACVIDHDYSKNTITIFHLSFHMATRRFFLIFEFAQGSDLDFYNIYGRQGPMI
jgi:hypothetical protein